MTDLTSSSETIKEVNRGITHQWVKKIGSIFTEKRLALGLTIEDVSLAIKINSKYIYAIENNCIDNYVSLVYQVGYIRNYARYLNINIDYIIQKFKEENVPIVEELSPIVETLAVTPSLDRNKHKKVVIVIFLAIIACSYMIFYTVKKPDYQLTKNIINKEIEKKISIDPYNEEVNGFYKVNDPLFKANNDEFMVIANENTDVKVFDKQSRLLLEKKVNAGEVMFLPQEKHMFVRSNSDVNLYDSKSLENFNPQAVVMDKDNKTYFVRKNK